MGKAKQPVSINGIEFDALISEDKSLTANVPQYAVEDGFSVCDTIILEAEALSMVLYLTPTPVTWYKSHGCRKCRIPLENRGKSGGARVIYVDFITFEKIYLITAYAKNEQENLSKRQCDGIKQLVTEIEAVERTKFEMRN